MVSLSFLLCSALLICGAIAAPKPAEKSPTAELDPELKAEIDKHAEDAAKKVHEDVAAGKEVKEAIRDRSVEASKGLLEHLASAAHSFSKRWNEYKNGDSIGDVAGRWWHSVVRKFTGQNETFDEFVKKLGSENIRDFVKSVANLIKYVLTSSIAKGKDIKGEDIAELAKNVKI